MSALEDRGADQLDAAPLSHAQRRLWMQVALDPADPAYHAYVALRLRGALDRRALQKSLDTVVDRHEMLRTTFTTQDGETLQVIHPRMPVTIRAAGRIRADEVDEEVRREIRRPFDLARGSLLRAVVYDLDDDNAVLLVAMHHLVVDGWSMGVFLREVQLCYRAFVTATALALPPLEIQYADFADWERERLQDLEKAQIEHWRDQLRPPLSSTEVLPDHPRPPTPSTRGAMEDFSLNLLADARRLATSQGVTLFMVLLAAFKVVLQRHAQADEVVIGAPVAARNHPEIEPLIGFFVNSVVLRTDLTGDPTFAEVLARVRHTILAAWENQELSFDRLVATLKPERRPGRRPFFDLMFALQPRVDFDLPGLTIELLPVASDTAKFDMTVICEELPDALGLRIEYSPDLYEAATVRRLAASFEQVLRAACADPNARIATMPIVPAAELTALLGARRERTPHMPAEPVLHQWFARTAAQYPDRIAASWQGHELTYGALARRAARLAAHLQAAGVRPRDRVALATERSLDLLVGILGILRAGAAYVPLDPAYPSARLAFMLADGGVSAVVTHAAVNSASLAGALAATGTGVPIIELEEADAAGTIGPADVEVAPTDAAYVIYTSGSTGKPKGVVVTHDNVTALFAATAATFGFSSRDVWTMFHSHAFDFSVWEIWGALLHGGRVVVVSREVSRTPEAFRELLVREGVTFLNQTPSAFAQLDAIDAGLCAAGAAKGKLALRHVVFGGEALNPTSLSAWFERHGDERPVLTNMYGITETTVHVTHRRMRAADACAGTPSLLGRAIDDLSLLVLDEHLQPVPIGTPGELFVGGRGVARGYLGQPALTATRFVPDPFDAGRLYRTGDRVRWGIDGGLEFLGRLDTQVKLRGFRIELGEIEHVLRAAGLRDAVVTLRDDGDNTQLVAYGVPATSGGCSPATLREACADALPAYMVPAAYVLLDALPLTPNGKLDVAALPAPDFGHDTARAEFLAPRSDIEKTIAAIWKDVLNVDRVGLHDNFFALGGDSIIMLQVAARASRAGLAIGRRDLIECQTVAELAGRARPAAARQANVKRKIFGSPTDRTAPAAEAADKIQDEYALTPLQEGLLFHGVYAPEDGHYIEQLHAPLDGELDVAAFERAWQTAIDRHAVLRTSFHWRGVERPVQRIARRVEFALELKDWRELAPSEQEVRLADVLAGDRARGFDLEQAPLTRVVLLRLGARRWHLIWTHHHLVLDGWSVPLVVGEVLAAYDAYRRGSEPVLPARRPYRDFIDWLATQDAQAARTYWRERLAGFDTPNRFHELERRAWTVVEAGAKVRGAGERNLVLAPEETAALQDLARAERVTLNTVISACWARLVALHSRSDDVVFGITVSGRPAELDGFEHMVGLFINTLPMRVRMRPEQPLGEWLRDIQSQQSAMRAHEHTRLVDVQHESAVRAGENLFETLFVFENYPVDPANLRHPDGLALGPVTFVERTNYPLAVAAIPGRNLALRIYYDRARFDDAIIERLVRELRNLVGAIVAAHRDARTLLVGDWGVLTPAEMRELIHAFGEVGEPVAGAATWQSFPARIRELARIMPDAIAVRCGADALSYAELDRRAARLATRLQDAGVGAETIVGLHLDRDIDFIVAVLAIWRAGGAYLPVVPSHPPARNALILEDANAVVVIARPGASAALAGRKVIELHRDWHRDETSAERCSAQLLADQLAYVIYTSGSTGRPKGTLLTHGGLANMAVGQGLFDVTPGSRVLQFASSSFDASIAEIAVTLWAGACLELADPGEPLYGPNLARLLRDRAVTHVTLPPTALATLPEAALPELRVLIVAGEACAPTLAERWGRGRRFINAYGPTEVTVCATLGEQGHARGRTRLDIGRPLLGLKARVVDAGGRLVPCGVIGELYIGGIGVGRGYLRQPGLTAERYRPDAHGSVVGARVYATGDLVRWRDDRTIEFFGRADHQIKLRGHRIETGEIEHVLRENGVRDAIVQAHVAADGTRRLVAYVLADPDGHAPTPAALRAACANRLPDYMIPAVYISVPEWPRTRSAKVDLRALPAPDPARDTVRQAYAAPETDVEVRLARIWEEVLGVERVGAEDDLFALGGDSILSLQIVARALAAGMRVSPRDLFEHPTVRRLAAVIGAGGADASATEAAAGDVPLTPIQRWFFGRELKHRDRWNQAVVLEVDPRVTADMLLHALQMVAAEHDALRLRYEQSDGIAQRLVERDQCGDLLPCVIVTAPQGAAPSTREAMERWINGAADDAHSRLDLTHGPLARAVIFTSVHGTPSHLLVVAHHLVIDGVSWRVLLSGVQQRLTDQLAGRAPEPSGKSVPFATWARRLSAYAASASLPVEYWLALSGTKTPPLPLDREASAAANTVASLRTVEIALDAATTAALLRDVPGVYHTRAVEPLLTACAMALAEWSGERHLLLDLESHGREPLPDLELDLSRTLGWFTSLYPVSIELPPGADPGATLCAVKEQLRRIPLGGMPFGLAVAFSDAEELRERLAQVPQPQVSFNYLGQLDQPSDDAILRLSNMRAGNGQHGDERRTHVLDVVAAVRGGELVASFLFSIALHDDDTIARLAAGFERNLRALVEHCLRPGAGHHTPADFPLCRIDPAALAALEGDSADIEDLYALSPLQQGLFFHAIATPGQDFYLQQLHGELRGALDAIAFEQAWRDLVQRHAIFRGRFVWEGLAEPLFVIQPAAELEVAILDWRTIDAARQDQMLADLLQADRRRGLVLDRAPLMRITIVQRRDLQWHWIWTHHHALLDGWCGGLVLREVLDGYEARRLGRPLVPAYRRPYRDYIAWLQRQDGSRAEAYWREALADFTTPTRVDLRGVPAAAMDDAAAAGEAWLSLSHAATGKLEAWARTNRLTLNTVLTGAWARLLAAYSHSDDVVFGVTVAGRPAELEGADRMIGLFINTLPQRVRIRPGSTIVEWLRALQEQQLAVREFEYCRLVDIQRASEIEPGVPLFETLIAFDNYPVDEALAQGFGDIEVVAARTVERTHYPLALSAVPGEQLRMRMLFDRRRAGDAEVEQLIECLHYLLETVSTGQVATVDAWSLVAPPPVLDSPPGAGAVVATDNLAARFTRAAIEHSDRIAVSCGSEVLTYRELAARAARLAWRLREAGARAGSLVGLYLDRTADLAVGIIGILQAGAAYVPIDPHAPAGRVAYMIADASLDLIVTHSAMVDALATAAPESTSAIVLDRDTAQPATRPAHAPGPDIPAESAAYVIYTSGSTGRPKGCVISHANVLRLFDSTRHTFAPAAEDVWTLFHSIAFDFSVWEMWGALLHGGRLVVVPHDVSRSPEQLHDLLQRERVTVLSQTPSAFQQLAAVDLRRGRGSEPAELLLRHVVFGGEALHLEQLRRWIDRRGDELPCLTNMYGITETTVHVTARRIRRADVESASGSVIGAPISDLSLSVLDPLGLPLPLGVAGELFVGGAGVARGYLERPALTAERFLPAPRGERRYRSGDLARRIAADVEYLGRIDQQVKVRGFRIELGEIEATLLECPAVATATVQAVTGEDDARHLVAYVVPGRQTSVEELRTHLARTLPDYMVPAFFVLLDHLPLTVNGKVDRRALPPFDPARRALAAAFVEPRNDTERILAGAFAAALGLERVGIHDNFYALGGDSIKSIKTVARARNAGLDLHFGNLIEHPTVAELAERLQAGPAEPVLYTRTEPFDLVAPDVRSALPADARAAYPLTRLQQGMLLETLDAGATSTYHDVMTYHVRAPWNREALEAALAVMVTRHEILRTSILVGVGPEPLQMVHAEATIPMQVDSLEKLSEQEQERLIETWAREETARPFDLERAPLLRVQVHLRSSATFQLSLSVHHAILDGWSVATLLTELFATYAGRLGYAVPQLSDPPSSTFRDYVALERRVLADEGERSFWRNYVEDIKPTLLPRQPSAGRSGPGAAPRRVQSFDIPIKAATSKRLEQLAVELGVPLRTVLLTAHMRALGVICGESDVVTGLVTNGRLEQQDGDRVLGLFLGTLPFRLRSTMVSWRELVQQVREVEKQIERRRRFPLAEIQRLAGQPLFETDFNFVHFHVFEQVLRMHDDFRTLGGRAFEETGFTLAVNFSLAVESKSIAGSLDLDIAAVTAEQGARYAAIYGGVIESLALRPGESASAANLLSRAEHDALIDAGRGPAASTPACLHELVSRRIACAPDAVAVTAGEQSLTFAGLGRRANQLAHLLLEHGVRPDAVVGVCTASACERVVALLAVLRAGAAYLPLEREQPPERLGAMLADAGARVIVVDDATSGRKWPEGTGILVMREDLLAGRPTTEPAVSVFPDNLAYVLFTSGSTGRPKGVQITHRAIANHMEWMRRRYPLVTGDRVLQKTPVSFDASVWEFWAPLVEGATLVLAPDATHQDPELLARIMRRDRISILQLVPTLLSALLEQPELARCGALRRLFVGGEPLSLDLARRVVEVRPGVEVVNLYGPAEATIDDTSCALRADHLVVAIGKPIDGMSAFVAEDALDRLAPMGTDGNLCLAGAGVARGYVGRPGLTAASFLPDALSGDAGGRLYATGDRARWVIAAADAPALELEFRGRADDQVKLYGQRVELGEIDAALAAHPGVRAAATLLLDLGASKRLVAHVVLAAQRDLSAALRAHLADRLPRALIPSAFVFHAALPQTVSGKIDRRALAAASADATESHRLHVAPRSEIERLLVTIFAEVLGVERVGITDDFYELGGDSIMALQVVSRLRRVGWRLSPRRILDHAIVAAIAAHAEALAARSSAVRPARTAAGSVPLAPIQRDLFARFDAIERAGLEPGRAAHWNQSMLLTVPAGLAAEMVRRAVEAVTAVHDATRSRFHRTPAGWEQRYVPIEVPGGIAFDAVDLSTATDWEAELASRAEQAQGGLDLEEGPIGRAVYFSRGVECGRLLLVLHHLVVDVVSWRILLEDLSTALARAVAGENIELPAASSPYPEWITALEARARAAEAEPWLALPVAQMGGPALDRLARDPRERADHIGNPVHAAKTVRVRLDEFSTRVLLRDAPGRLRTRPEELLVAALLESLSTADEASSLWLDLEGHGRGEFVEGESAGLDLSRTIGWFTALYPVCLLRSAGTRGGELLRAVKRSLRPLSARGADFGALLYGSPDPEIRARLAALPRREIAFNFLGRLDAGGSDGVSATSGIAPAPESAGHDHDPAGERHYLLEVIARVSDGELVIDWIYPGEIFLREAVELHAGKMVRSLKDLLASDAAAAAAPSDFPLARLGEGELAALLAAHPDAESILPPSPLQEGLLFHALDDDQPGVYVQQITAQLDGKVDRRSFEAAWNGILRRHDALRASFHRSELDGHAYAIVHRDLNCPVEWLDWADLVPTGVEQRWRRLLVEDRARGFRVDSAPLMRVQIAHVGDHGWRVLWSHHHLLLDGWSLPLVLNDVIAQYRALTEGTPAPGGPTATYEDYLAWRAGREQTAALAFWRDALRGFDAPSAMLLPSPAVALSPDVEDDTHAELEVVLPEAVTAALSALARDNHLTLAAIVQCWWAYLVARFSGRRDVVFGVTVAGRPAGMHGIETTVGLFINTLPVRVGVPVGCTLLGLAGRMDPVRAALTEYEDSRLVDIQRLADVPRGTELFDSILVFQNYPLGEALADSPLADFTVRDVGAVERTHYPLTCFVTPGEQLRVRIGYDATRFSREGVERLLEHAHRTLVVTAESPTQPLEPMLAFPQRELGLLVQATESLNRGDAWAPLHERIARIAAREPDRMAVVCGSNSLSYRELALRSSRLARALNQRGIGAEDLVGIYLERSVDMLVALLGVLGAGAAYVPLDPRFPRARLDLMVAESAVRVVVTHGELATQLPRSGLDELLLMNLDDLGDDTSGQVSLPVVHPDSLAYVIFTSGSTGRPKGVQVPHAALANVVDSFAATPGLTRADTFLAVTTLSFDIAALELFLPLTVGARLVIAGAEEATDSGELGELIECEGATVMQATPATWQMLVAAGWKGRPDLSLWSGGEALPPDLAVELLARGGALWNVYGPTETTIWSTGGAVRGARDARMLGRPIAATATYIVDSALELAPSAVPGELLIAGRGVARGYRGQPGLTADRFVPHAFGASPGARAYRTGDEVRSASGELEFLGRLDQQVKIRGFRVELGEIETALRAMPTVANAAATVRLDQPGHPRLVAYVVPAGTADASMRGAIGEKLSETLPAYMLPSAYVFLDALPLTPNGKIDRRALPPPGDARGHEAEIVAPRDEVEEAIAGIWQDALGVEKIGVTENFFDLGGDSLVAASLLSMLRQAFKIELRLRAFFAAPTVGQLARAISELEERPGRTQQVARALLRIRAMSPQAKALLREQRQAKEEAAAAARSQQETGSNEGR